MWLSRAGQGPVACRTRAETEESLIIFRIAYHRCRQRLRIESLADRMSELPADAAALNIGIDGNRPNHRQAMLRAVLVSQRNRPALCGTDKPTAFKRGEGQRIDRRNAFADSIGRTTMSIAAEGKVEQRLDGGGVNSRKGNDFRHGLLHLPIYAEGRGD